MKKTKRLLAAVLITSMLFGSNGVSYAAEAAAGNANEAVMETAVQEQQSDFNEEKAPAVTQTETETDDHSAGAEEKAEPVSEQEDDPAPEETAKEAQADHAEAADSVEEADSVEDAEAVEDEETAEDAEAAEDEETAEDAETAEDETPAEEAENTEDVETAEKAEATEDAGTAEEAETGDAEAKETDAAEEADADTAEATEETATSEAAEAASEMPAEAAVEQPAAEVFTAGELVYRGAGYSVTMSYDADAKIPADAELKVREIQKGTAEYDSYLSGAEAASDKGVADARFFDITIWAKGQEIQPQSAVRVNISYNNAIEVADEGEVTAMHFEDGSGDAEVLHTDTNGGSEVSEIAFDAESFSVYGVVYTVDFTYEGYTFTMPGEGSVLLSILAGELKLYEKDYDKAFSVDNVSDVTFTDYDLVKIEKHADDWLLTGLASFESEETLTITMKDGVKFVISVTDPPEADTRVSSDLTEFLTKVVVQGATQDADGRYVVRLGEDYSFIATFAESSEVQFQNDADLTYQMPQGIVILSEQEGPFKINIVYKGRTYEVDASYRLTTDGHLTIKFDESDPDYSKLVASTNVSFRFTYSAQFDGTSTEINFSDDVERDIVFEEPEAGQVYVSKNAQYDEKAGRFTYTIKVNATGDVTNVNVKDVITGNALIFNSGDVRVTGNSSDYTDHGAANGFDYTFDSMKEGEEITITYSADVDFSKDTDRDGKITADQTKNTVTVEPEGGEPHKGEYQREIRFKSTAKGKGTIAGTEENGDKIIEWKIVYNPLAVANASGDTITDSIEAGSAYYMTYYGDGLTVNVYDRGGNLVRTDNVRYDQLTDYSASSWTYTIPDGESAPYSYEITYQTIVDMEKVNGRGAAVTLINDANGSGESVVVTPDKLIGVQKDVVSSSTEEITWISTISVPENGLAQAVATDTLPHVYLHGRFIYDTYQNGSLKIDGLVNGESYDVTYSADKVVITFYKDAGKTQTGLQAVEGGHTITVKLTTEVDQEWLEAGYDGGETEPDWTTYLMNHTNTFDLNTVTDTATVVFDKPGMEKSAEIQKDGQGKVSSILYTIVLKGVSDTPVSIEDTFDTSVLEIDASMSGAWDHFMIWGGNQDYQGQGKTPVSYSETADGVLITANTVPMQPDGNYYSHYRICYYLRLKEGIDLDQLAIANGGEYDLVNTAKWNGHESTYSYKTVYDYLDKQLLNEGEIGGTNRTAKYQITFNSAQATLNDGEPMEMTDTLSPNLSLDYGSIVITTVPEGESVPYSLKGADDGSTIATYTVPDSTKVVITYEAMVTGNGPQKIINKVSVKGKDETVEDTKEYGSASEGEGAVASFKIVKVDGYDAGKKLSGVKFKLFSEKGLYFDDDHKVREVILTTDENGEAVIDGNEYNIYFNEVYHLQEIEGPDDYGKISFDYLITLTNDMALVDYDHFIYYYSDSMQIKNWPLEGLVVEKQVESAVEEDLDRYYDFRISILKDDGSVDTDYNEKNGDDQFVNGVVEFELKSGEQKMFWGFDKGTKYKVEEILTDDDRNVFTTTVSYDIFDEEGEVIEHKTETASSHSGELTQEDETIVFTNTRPETGSLKIRKTVNGDDAKGTYEIAVKNSDGHYFDVDGTDKGSMAFYVTFAKGQEQTWSDLVPGTYTVEEKDAEVSGYTWTVSGTGGNVTVEAGKEASAEVGNTYVKHVEKEIEAVKNFTGRAWKSGDSFEFTLEPVDGAPMPSDAETTADGGKQKKVTVSSPTAVSFGMITYTAEGEYKYTVTETQGNLPGVTYDTTPHEVTVNVTKDSNNHLVAAVTYTEGEDAEEITNTFEKASATLEATKAINDWGGAESFTFNLAAKDGAPLPKDPETGEEVTSRTVNKTDVSRKAVFGTIEFDAVGTYEYTITEVNDGVPGITYDAASHNVVVTVAKDTDSNALVATVKYDNEDTLTITNRYASATVTLEAAKEIEYWGNAEKFTFNLAAVDGAPLPRDDEGHEVTSADATQAKPLATFGKIKYEEEGTFEYTITEQDDGEAGITYDTTPHRVVVKVERNNHGDLEATVKYDNKDSLTITNTFTSVKAQPEVTKAITEWGKATGFTFDLEAAGNAPMPEGAVDGVKTVTVTKGQSPLKAVFGEIEFKAVGEYSYTITEHNDGVDGITYDTEPHTVLIKVTKNEDTNALEAEVAYDDGESSLTISNTFTAAEVTLEATKDFNDWGKATGFTFDLAAVSAVDAEGNAISPIPVPEKVTATATQSATTASFGKVKYDQAGTYIYTITEQNGGADGVTYDTVPHKVVVTVTRADDATNKLTATVKYDGEDSLTITNTYTSVKKELEAAKQINDWGTVESFTFTLKAKDGAPMPADAEDGAKSVEVTEADPLAGFGEIEYEKAGVYEYTITEEKGDADGVTYDTTAHAAVVTVTKDPETNALSAEVKYDGENTLTITNKYASADVDLQAKKEFDGWGKADSFTFTLKAVTGDAPMPEGTSDGEKTATATRNAPVAKFGEITYKTAGTYEYTITETDDGKDGVTYDTTPHKVVVTVTKDENNKLVAEARYDGKDSLTITNTYEAAKASLEATKNFGDWGKADSFTFDLEAVDNAPMPAGAADGRKSGTATKAEPVVNFGEITFEKAGTYEYTITEQNGGADGVSYDVTPHKAVVTVTKGKRNKLTAEVKYDDKDSLIITNTYAATEAELKATKDFNDWGKAESFTFKLEAVTEKAPMPEKTSAMATEAAPEVSFGKITYEKAGTYEYTITEVNDGVDGVTYDTTAHKVTVVVTKADDATNALTAEVKYDGEDSLIITNTYAVTKAALEATKEFNDWGKAESFTFNLKAVTKDAPMPEKTEAVATKDEPAASFGEITFEKAGTYEYEITEVNDGVDGVSYDTTAHKAVVTVSKEEGTNKLSASVKYDGEDSLIITNSFTAVEATLEAAKNFNDWGRAESFTFDLAAVTEGAPMPENTEATATKDKVNAVFGKVVYDKAGTYEYTITERNDGADGVTYDTTAHNVKVEVTKAEDATNKLSAKVTYDGADMLIVTNTYASASATIQATKKFDDWGKADSFTFELAAVTEGAPMPDSNVATATESAKTAVFGSVEYEKTGRYEYTITERNDGVDGVTYDTRAHKVVVDVTKDADGRMTATVTYDGEANLIITNTFTAAKAHFEATKEFNDWGKADSFTFDLEAVTEGAPMPAETTATAVQGKKAVFGEIEFDKAGTYEYTITEQNGGADGVSYDVTPHKAAVTVTKDEDTNELSAVVSYDGEKELVITNTFTAATAHVEAAKGLENRDWSDADEFEFELAAVTEGAPMPKDKTAKATKDSRTAIFGDMEFEKAGTYLYTITEKDGGIKGITYDTEPHSVTVTVEKAEDETNKLTATVAYDGMDKLEITNKYASEGEIILKAKKELKGRHIALNEGVFEFRLMDEEGSVLQTAKNDAFGNVEFDKISYTQDDIDSWDAEKGTGTGTKKYTVKEVIQEKDGYTFDENEFEITVTLTDDGEGAITAEADKVIDDLVFTNEYKAEGEIVLHAKKVFLSENELREGQFTFELKDADGNLLDTKTNAADGTVTFDAIRYTQDDIYITDETGAYTGEVRDRYTYTISEVIPEGAKDNGDGTFDFEGYTYDGTVYTVTVVLTDNGDGTITAVDAADEAQAAEGTTSAGGAKAESRYVFTNAYAADGTLKLDAKKTFKHGVLKGGEFTFELKDADGKVLQSKSNDAAGKVSFDMIAYTLADVTKSPFTYTVSEMIGTKTDVKYDTAVYTVTVSLKDKGNGELEVTKKIDNGGKLKFVNEQLDVETSIEIGGVKVLKGRDLKAGQFKFVMADENGKTVGEARNDAGGDFTFGKITYKLSDLNGSKKRVYTYSIYEVEGSDRRIIYDKKVYTVTVTVTYSNGKLTATASKDRADIKFVNTTREKTGDDAPFGVLFGGLGFGVVGLAVLLEERRRRNKKA